MKTCFGHWIRTIPFVDEDQTELVAALVMRMTPLYYPAGEQFVFVGETPEKMYMIRKGLVGCDNRVRRRDDCIGWDIVLLSMKQRDYSATALTFVCLMALERNDLFAELQATDRTTQERIVRRARWLVVRRSSQRIGRAIRTSRRRSSSEDNA